MKIILIIGILLLVLGIGLVGYSSYEYSLYRAGLSSLPVEDIDFVLGLGLLSILVSIVIMLILFLMDFIMNKIRKTPEKSFASRIRAMCANVINNVTNTVTKYLSKSAVKTNRDGKVVIKRTFVGNLSFVLLCLGFVVSGLLIMQLNDDTLATIIGIITIVFFGGGGLMVMIIGIRKPIAIISDKGITIPHGWGEHFAAWENIVKIEVVEQIMGYTKQEYIGIYVFDRRKIARAGKISQAITKKATGWKHPPALIINLSFSFLNVEYIAGVLQELHDKYKNA